MKETEFKISEYETTYNNQKLPFGKPISEWDKIIGKPNRIRKSEDSKIKYSENFWDGKGLKLILGSEENYGMNYLDYKVKPTSDILYIYFKDMYYVRSEFEVVPISIDDSINKINEAKVEKKFPAKNYVKSFNLDGAEIKTGMTIKEINKNRKELNLPEFYDFYESQGGSLDIFPRHGSGKKTNDDGMYLVNYEDEIEGKDRIYGILLWIVDNVIEHIEISADIHEGKVIK